mmetsp:Transcript_67228/g.161094  ORF Transcript_67228/g.161094 Transcript_67228/m.161094 type:complete len:1092 (-) Transcript_67228:129-3404(-)|eukprot:CAMPEP_0178387152 /NCGR_PEP_ID=MMETSP0689_2-20121128/8927_1 /TAXON_ID=160604 /ORGANISM="Amphidinium massartii, Strain CS-259" /LENGTH=1091 /DNA_ID=CAMNT_0020007509 /DNA_START=71 /DNA_END=3346 /DNA_ORIENTATION=-
MTVPAGDAKENIRNRSKHRNSSNGEVNGEAMPQKQRLGQDGEAAKGMAEGLQEPRATKELDSKAAGFHRNVSSVSSDDGASSGGSPPAHLKLSMFAHMFRERGRERLVDLRRRSLTLVDVVTDRQANGPLRLLPLIPAFSVAAVYWYCILPSMMALSLTARTEAQSLAEYSRPGGPWSEVRWEWAIFVTVTYVIVVLVGLGVMEKRPPVQNRIFEYMLVYNLTQVMLNASLGYSLWKEAWNFPYPWGNGLEDTSARSHRLGMLLWFHYHCRQLELFDTGFIIMRKKFESWSFLALHAYLRLAHMWGWYFACRFACGGDSYFPAAVSCTCQVCVYLYYTLSMLRPEGVPLFRRARVTEVQVLQFIVCATHAVIVLVNGNLPRPVTAVSLVVMASGLYLYVEWDGQEAHIRPLKKHGNLKELSMFAHMFTNESVDLATLRRRTMTLIDVIAERQENGQLRPHRLLTAFGLSLVYWNFVLPSLTWWGTGRWYAESSGPASQQAGGPWASVNWSTAIMLTVGYLFTVLAGTRFMERRPPVQKRIFEYLVIYNFTQVILNASLGFNLWREAWQRFQYPWGNGLEDVSEQSHRLGMLLWFQYHCRQLELIDTFFIILRKKFHHMSFLHIFLRLAHMWGWFFACRFACGGDSYFPAAINCTCQVIVYLYYTLSLIHDKPGRNLLLRRAFVTEVQMSQFIICMVHAGFVLYKGNLPRFVALLSLLTMVSSLFLYVDFGGDSPNFGSKASFAGNMGANPQEQNDRLNFRFDSSGWLYVYHFGVAIWIQEHLLPEDPSPELAVSDRYPKALAFSGSSGGGLVALGLASGTRLRDLFEQVLSVHGKCRKNPYQMFTAVEESMKAFLPKNAALSVSGRVRLLLTRVSAKPPFITGEVVDQFATWSDVFHRARATCHVPGMHLFPYRVQDRYYFDGLVWSSLMVPWSDYGNHVVKVSAISAPLTDIRAPKSPLWWIIMPPGVPALRGLFWLGYRDAHRWFTAPAEDTSACGLGCGQSRGRRGSKSEAVDPLIHSRVTKRRLAQQLVLRQPSSALPEFDPVTGESVEELIACYRRAASRAFMALYVAIAVVTAALSYTVFGASGQ